MTEAEYSVQNIEKEDIDDVMDLLKRQELGEHTLTLEKLRFLSRSLSQINAKRDRTFYIDEPLNQTVELCTEGSECPELDEYCSKSLLEGLSLKAVDNDGKIIGVCICGVSPLREEDNGNDLNSQARRCQNVKFQKILHILAKREEGARLWEKFPDHQNLVEVKVTATDPQWRRKGIMNKLVKVTESLVKQRNIRLLRLDTSSYYSARSAERQGFTCVYKVLYSNLMMDGSPIIQPKPPHLDDRVYIKEV